MQKIFYKEEEVLKAASIENKNIFIVCGNHFKELVLLKKIKKLANNIILFSEFGANPKYEEVVKAIALFKQNNCNYIIAIGGGSAIDIAKIIKAFQNMNSEMNYLEQVIHCCNIPLLVIPTTAGTGSESTHFAVVYYDNKKYSVEDDDLLPNYVYLNPIFLKTLPLYQKKSTMLDALCQGIESYWSVKATLESKRYAKKAIRLILENFEEYLNDNEEVYMNMLLAANYSGKAINISKTTAAHAMSYRITSLYSISHGHAVAIILPHLWRYMADKLNDEAHSNVDNIFSELYEIFEVSSFEDLSHKLSEIYKKINLNFSHIVKREDLIDLVQSVNIDRLNNNPIKLDSQDLFNIYNQLI